MIVGWLTRLAQSSFGVALVWLLALAFCALAWWQFIDVVRAVAGWIGEALE